MLKDRLPGCERPRVPRHSITDESGRPFAEPARRQAKGGQAVDTDREQALARWRTQVREAVGLGGQQVRDGYPLETVRRLLALGVQRIPFSAALGGEGLGVRGLAAVLEDLAAEDGSLAAIVMGLYSANAFLAAEATPSQRQGALASLLAGDGLAAVAVTEPEAGTDVGSIRTTCRQLGDGRWRLEGRKAFISNTGHPLWRFTIVLAQGPMADRHTAFLVPHDAPGLTVAESRATIGWSRVGVHDLELNGVIVRDSDRMGEPGEGLPLALAEFDRGRVAVAALATGLCRGAWEVSLAHARQRQSFGQPLIAHQAVADHLVTLWRLYTRARLVTELAADALDAARDFKPWAALAKWEATDAAVAAARLAVQTLGARGLLQGSRGATLWADAKTLEIVEGTTEVQTMVLRRRLQQAGLPVVPSPEGA